MKTILLFFVFIFLTSCTQTFYIVRHAEKADNSDDPVLSNAGIQRTVLLQNYMADKGIDTVFSSDKKRTILTGLSVALEQQIPQIVIKQGNAIELNKFIARLKKISGNTQILVVGHTNTIKEIIRGLTTQIIDDIPESQYGNLYIIKKTGNDITLEQTHYEN
jgi:2,3-bisphosphoglycerate-dependent phosphoglycerate mutase